MLNVLVAPLVLALLTGTICLLLRRRQTAQRMVSVIGGLTQVAVAMYLLVLSASGIQALHVGSWEAPIGISLVLDRLSAIMVMMTGLTGLATAVYALREVSDDDQRQGFHPLLHFLMFGVNGAFMTGDIFNLYVWFEVLLISSFVLLGLGGKKEQTEGAVKYVALNLVGSAIFLTTLGILYGTAGTLNMAQLSEIVVQARLDGNAGVYDFISMLLLTAFGMKAGIFPLYFWLPSSYHTPSPAVSALFAGLLTKVGVYTLMRIFTLIIPPGSGGYGHDVLLVLAILTMVLGVLGAAAQAEFRRVLSFHIISQVGYMVLGLALATKLALAAVVFYLAHHIVVKANLFFVGGLATRLTGKENLYKTGGLARISPWLAVAFIIPAFSLAGLPPLSGFVAKLGIVEAIVDKGAWISLAASLAVGLFTLYSMMKIWYEAF